MAAALIVAAPADAGFAEEVRATTRGLDIEIASVLPANGRRPVLLLWSAARAVGDADLAALLELSSRGRLVVARRDDQPLPPELSGLDTLPSGASARETAFRLLKAALAAGEEAESPPVAAPASPPPAIAPPSPLPAAAVPASPVPAVESPRATSGAHWLVVMALVAVVIAGGVILGSLGP
jgi:hypothetical protein